MSDNPLLELHKRHDEAQKKYTYFLLAVTASAVAFSVQKTDNMALSWSMIPLGLAVISWGTSFFCGTKNLTNVHSALAGNYIILQLQKGVHPKQPEHPQLVDAAIDGTKQGLNSDVRRAYLYSIWQFRLLIAGALLFLSWHILEMVLRSRAT